MLIVLLCFSCSGKQKMPATIDPTILPEQPASESVSDQAQGSGQPEKQLFQWSTVEETYFLQVSNEPWQSIPLNTDPLEYIKDPNNPDVVDTAHTVLIAQQNERLLITYDLHSHGDGYEESRMEFDQYGRLVSFEEKFYMVAGCEVSGRNQVIDFSADKPSVTLTLWANEETGLSIEAFSEEIRKECSWELEEIQRMLNTSSPLWTSVGQFPQEILSVLPSAN